MSTLLANPERIDIFISWSGPRAEYLATALHDWLSLLAGSRFVPWMSNQIEPGAQWMSEIRGKLESHHFGILCVTPENQLAPWLLFEAGALSKLGESRVCPVLAPGMRNTDLQYPLASFNNIVVGEAGLANLAHSYNRSLGANAMERSKFQTSIERHWAYLKKQLDSFPEAPADAPKPRKAEDKTDEMLSLLRTLQRNTHPKYLRDVLAHDRPGLLFPEEEPTAALITVEVRDKAFLISLYFDDVEVDSRLCPDRDALLATAKAFTLEFDNPLQLFTVSFRSKRKSQSKPLNRDNVLNFIRAMVRQ